MNDVSVFGNMLTALELSKKEHKQAQEILDELAAGIESGTIKNPLPWISAVMARGLNRTPAGLKKEDQRPAFRFLL